MKCFNIQKKKEMEKEWEDNNKINKEGEVNEKEMKKKVKVK